ncbi:hypothetical protein [Arthrobacter bambusae]|uniref:hypothetical protein n=1 Tax=Arthrobacter bambusae TaxID=1338426 RepID=UPI0027803B71|nr:hypothetical protein [Arthrobacter bambusae]MDQ0028466.1 quinol monooxygenase YgiN [Arthrobacter bambusae]MDQ0096739.1 quinol monooxygenase YgiN [Arthrobacter bambusae]
MSVIIATKISGDTSVFVKSLEERADEYRQMGERGRAAGAIHHQFAVGDGFVLVVDEWESTEAFQKFFGNPEIQAFIGSAGGDPNVAPVITVAEAIDSADKY